LYKRASRPHANTNATKKNQQNQNKPNSVRWYVTSLGSEDAIHTAHWHGVIFTDSRGHHTDQVPVQSASLETLTMVADNPGTWLFHCHLNDHMDGGMLALFNVTGARPAVKLAGKVRLGEGGGVVGGG
jgi:hephaestin